MCIIKAGGSSCKKKKKKKRKELRDDTVKTDIVCAYSLWQPKEAGASTVVPSQAEMLLHHVVIDPHRLCARKTN